MDAISRAMLGSLHTGMDSTQLNPGVDPDRFTGFLVGHYAIVFDIPILLRASTATFRQALRELNVYFGDSLTLAKHLLKEQ